MERNPRNRERERASHADGALDLDLAAVRFDRQFAEGEAEAGANLAAPVELTELLEDPLERFGRNAGAGIADCEANGFLVGLRRGDGHSARWREPDGIG